jgi:hypothetical protein
MRFRKTASGDLEIACGDLEIACGDLEIVCGDLDFAKLHVAISPNRMRRFRQNPHAANPPNRTTSFRTNPLFSLLVFGLLPPSET